jgi:hypothetical protein
MPKTTVLTDGSFDWSSGVDSSLITTVRSAVIPRGLRREQLAWGNNLTVRGGGITQRTGIISLATIVPGGGLWQGGIIYDPFTQNPWLICLISGHVYQVLLEAPFTVTDLSIKYGQFHPAAVDQAFFVQAEQFVVIQAGDGTTLPIFYDGVGLRRSNGIIAAGNPNNELPAAFMMVYYAQRIWYAQGRIYSAGDIVNGPSGTPAYKFIDSVLHVTENPLASGGDGFRLPSTAGTIRALSYSANLDTTLGQGPLYIFTRKQVYSLVVPLTRADWISATAANPPLQTVVQYNNGATSDRSIAHVNGDLWYQSLDPAIRSFFISTRFFKQWGNKPLSSNLLRALQANDRALMRFCSGIYFDNRMLQLILPETNQNGVVSKAIASLDFNIISSPLTEQETDQPAWEGVYDGLDFMHLFAGDFGGRERGFAIISSRQSHAIEVWELTNDSRTDNSPVPGTLDHRVLWKFETPAFNFDNPFELKQLQGGEIWVDKIFGTVLVDVDYRPDADPCWRKWFSDSICVARNCEEDSRAPICEYPPRTYREGYKWTLTLPKAPPACDSMGVRPTDIGYQFQMRVTIKGWMRIRGIVMYGELKEKSLYEGLKCP